MNIEQFVKQSAGEWRSMRSGHSLAFQQFEEVLSVIEINPLKADDSAVVEFINAQGIAGEKTKAPFAMKWEAESDWEPDDPTAVAAGQCILVPIPETETTGVILRSVGYAEAEQASSNYSFSSDGTFILHTKYGQSIAEERIWFVSENVRCRSSVLRTSEGSGILQTSFASEVRRIKPSAA